MAEIAFDNETIGYIRLFEERTGARVRDCLETEEKLVFLVYPGEVHKAVGPGGVLVDRLKGMLKKEIQVVEYLGRHGGARQEHLLLVLSEARRLRAQGQGPPRDRHGRPGVEGPGHREEPGRT